MLVANQWIAATILGPYVKTDAGPAEEHPLIKEQTRCRSKLWDEEKRSLRNAIIAGG